MRNSSLRGKSSGASHKAWAPAGSEIGTFTNETFRRPQAYIKQDAAAASRAGGALAPNRESLTYFTP